MPLHPVLRNILATALALGGMVALSACGQKGPLSIPATPAAAQRATLPQTILGGTSGPARPASAATAPAVLAPELPNIPDIQ